MFAIGRQWSAMRGLRAGVLHEVSRGQEMTRTLMFMGTTIGGYVGWWAGETLGFDLMGTFLMSSLGTLIGIFAAWKVSVDYLS
jgi:hypothetical protein